MYAPKISVPKREQERDPNLQETQSNMILIKEWEPRNLHYEPSTQDNREVLGTKTANRSDTQNENKSQESWELLRDLA